MKILLTVEFYNPNKGGAQKVIEDLAESLVVRGHDVTVATSYLKRRPFRELRGVKIEEFKIRGNIVEGITGGKKEVERYQNFLLNGGFDVIFNYAVQIWTTDLVFPVLYQISAVKLLNPVGHSKLHAEKYKKYYESLPGHLKRYDRILYHSENFVDKKYGDEVGLSSQAVVIPNGALGREFEAPVRVDIREKYNIKTPFVVATVTHHLVRKGHRFVIRAFRQLNRKDTTLIIFGDAFTQSGLRRVAHFFFDYLYCFFLSLFSKNILLLHGTRDDALAIYSGADICVFGSRWECAPLVMYESFASGLPLVATPVGNIPDYGDVVSIVKTPAEMSRAIGELLDDEELRESLGSRTRNLWKEKYVWEDIANQYEELFLELHHGAEHSI